MRQFVLEEEGRSTVGGELRGRVADVHKLGRDVALPQRGDALIAENVADGRNGPSVCWSAAERVERVGEGVRLEL